VKGKWLKQTARILPDYGLDCKKRIRPENESSFVTNKS